MINKSLITPSVAAMVLAVLILFSAVNAVAVTSMFDSGLDGWTSNTPAEISWRSSGGVDDSGYVRFEDASFNGTRIYAPASFLGNWSGLDGIEEAITYRHKIFQVGVNPAFLPYRVEISGPGGAAIWKGETPSGTTEWVPVSASLREEDWVISAGSWSALLSDVQEFKILIEGVSNGGPGLDSLDITGIDYVILAAGIGACCLPDGSCTEGTVEECGSAGGAYQGDDTECASVDCPQPPQPTGACCLPDGSCTEGTVEECGSAGGAYQGDDTECGSTDCELLQVHIDIKPGSCPNPFRLPQDIVDVRRKLPVAILGTGGLDVMTIDPATIGITRECDGCEPVYPLRWAYEDVATPFVGEQCDCHELGPDGGMDLTLKFRRKSLAKKLKLYDVVGETIPLTITGNLKEEYGGTPIEGEDCVRIRVKK